ncbi:50S ribosome-binding protein YggL [Thalassotalea ponticola]|uniref:50S ribosome-binding protein YggL n=1 Tax=Thalassotalea ponticola TaxID=1523392 RepID=UPI0025B38F4C|nr:50S ribosome-binding protein YggL [Thalassotalea ponticola]MDN3652607.1 50S ribosome-binding protein YggL [Thalassotalea ponticola]
MIVLDKAKNRSRRLRKKLRVDEFQELGFDVTWSFADSTTSEDIDMFIDQFFAEAIEPHGLGFGGEGDLHWSGLVCTQKLGKCTEEDRQRVEKWLVEHGAQSVVVSPLYDVWWS